MTLDISGKQVGIRYVGGPVDVHSRNFGKARTRLRGGIRQTYAWVAGWVRQFAV